MRRNQMFVQYLDLVGPEIPPVAQETGPRRAPGATGRHTGRQPRVPSPWAPNHGTVGNCAAAAGGMRWIRGTGKGKGPVPAKSLRTNEQAGFP